MYVHVVFNQYHENRPQRTEDSFEGTNPASCITKYTKCVSQYTYNYLRMLYSAIYDSGSEVYEVSSVKVGGLICEARCVTPGLNPEP